MIRNPFVPKPKSPVEQAVDAFDSVRADAARHAASVRDAAAGLAQTLSDIGPPPRPGRRTLPIGAGIVAAGLGIAYLVRSRLAGGSPSYAPETPVEPAVGVGSSAAEQPPLAATPTEAPKDEPATVTEKRAPSIEPTPKETPNDTKASTSESKSAVTSAPSEPTADDEREAGEDATEVADIQPSKS